MFIDTDKIGCMGTISKDQWKGKIRISFISQRDI